MQNRYVIVLLAACLLTLRLMAAPTGGSVIVKFKENTSVAARWLAAERSTPIEELSALVGAHTSRGLLSNATVRCVEQAWNKRMMAKSSAVVNSLARIAVITYTAPYSPQTIARKLNSLDFVEYAEVLPERTLSFIPNDPMFNEQYFLTKTKASDAWDAVASSTDTALIAIVDTGIDYAHEDLQSIIFTNAGETGVDNNGKDKKSNGVDDDKNGFIDDWRGWDFVGFSSGSQPDNDPMPGNPHGTHCAGIAAAHTNNSIGIAGVCIKAKLLPCKVAGDPSFSNSVINSYDGIAYAAAMGADVINCSWGGPQNSNAEQEVINTAISLGSVVVAAAGNDGTEVGFYPASYKGVVSVAAVGSNDVKAPFSNYDNTVDVNAPGMGIFATVPGNEYTTMDGTSMASPLVAGVVGMIKVKYPSFSTEETIAMLKATCDNTDARHRNQSWEGKMGDGRVNVLKAVSSPSARYMAVRTTTLSDEDGDNVLESGNKVMLSFSAKNILDALKNCSAVLSVDGDNPPITLVDSVLPFGAVSKGEIRNSSLPFSFRVNADAKANTSIQLTIKFLDTTTTVGTEHITAFINPTYRNLLGNNVKITVNSEGNFGFNDYPSNDQGIGLLYKEHENILFESGLVVANSADQISDVARGNESGDANQRGKSFSIVNPITVAIPGVQANTEATTRFSDKDAFAFQTGVDVKQTVYQFNTEEDKNYVITQYRIINISDKPLSTLHCGLYNDWDIGESGQNNKVQWDNENGMYYCYNTTNPSLPYTGMQLLTNQQINFFAIDNDGATPDNPGVYDAFTKAEKWQTISSGIQRTESKVGDVSAMYGAGPMSLNPGDTAIVAFSIFCGDNLSELQNTAKRAKTKATTVGVGGGTYTPSPSIIQLTCSPNPSTSPSVTITYTLPVSSVVSVDIVDILGKPVATLQENIPVSAGTHSTTFNASNFGVGAKQLAQTSYYVRLRTILGTVVEPLYLVR